MKIILALTLFHLTAGASAATIPLGVWTLNDAGCTNPAFQLPADEQAGVDLIRRHEMVDIYDFQTDHSGTYITRFSDRHGGVTVDCEGQTTFEYSYPSENSLLISAAPMTWVTHSAPDGNTTITCSGNETEGFQEQINYEINQNALRFLYNYPDPQCGKYFMSFTGVTTP